MLKRAMLVAIMVMLMVVPAMAQNQQLILHEDFWGVDSFYDYRTYHESHPGSETARNHGGWIFGLTFDKPNAKGIVGSVIYETSPSIEGHTMTVTVDNPMEYPWVGSVFHDYSLFLGHRIIMGSPITVTPLDKAGNPIDIILDEFTTVNSLTVTPSVDHALPPICTVKRMAIKKDGQLMVKFTAPYDTRNNHIRIRVWDADNLGAEEQFRYDPPYEIHKKNGTIVPDKMRILLPGEYAGRQARIEYRVYEDDGYMSRGITYIVLPSLE